MAAFLQVSARYWRGVDRQLCPRTGNRALSGRQAQPRYRRLHGHVRDRLCSRAATRRGARSTLGLASRILVSCPDRVHPLDRHGWLEIGLLAAAAASLVGFVRWEHRVAQPIVNLDLLRTGGFAALNLASILVYLTSFSVLLFGPYYLIRVAGLSVPMAGTVLAASFVGSIVASPLAGLIIERVSAGRVAALGAFLGGAGL